MKKQSRPPTGEGNVLSLACEARLHLFIREHSRRTLAQALGITPGELDSVLIVVKRDLAKQGIRLRLTRRAGRAHYQLLGYDRFIDRAWREFDRSLKRFWARPPSPPIAGGWSRVDEALYGDDRPPSGRHLR